MIEVVINATKNSPEMRFTDTKSDASGLSWARLISSPQYNSTLRVSGKTQTPSGDISIDNGDGSLTNYLDWRVIGADVSVAEDGSRLFSGKIYSIEVGQEITLGMEA